MESCKSFFVFLKFQVDDRWSECRKLMRNLRNGRVKISLSSGHLFILFCCPYDVLVVMDDWMTANMDPCFMRWVCIVVSLHPVTNMQQNGSHWFFNYCIFFLFVSIVKIQENRTKQCTVPDLQFGESWNATNTVSV